MAKKNACVGRPRKPYRTTWGEHVNGLRQRKSDGRWVIVETGQTFTEADERRAVQRFKRWQADQQGESIVELVVKPEVFETKTGYRAAIEAGASIQGHFDGSTTLATICSALCCFFIEESFPAYGREDSLIQTGSRI